MSGNIIKQKAFKIYKHLQEVQQTTIEQKPQLFCASKGWMERFKARYSQHNIRLKGESADETGLNWKKLQSRTYISKKTRTLCLDSK